MDVRCENCQVEYELEDRKLKAGGVTVKCANCGHMFRIRKRTPRSTRPGPGNAARSLDDRITAERPAVRPDETTQPNAYSKGKKPPPAPYPPADKTPPPERLPAPPSGPSSSKAARKWLIRLETGEVQTCRELATLQKWIVAGMVTRKCHISRTGKTWKPLGQISELKMFFDIAEEARLARAQSGPTPAPAARSRRGSASKPPPLPVAHAHRNAGLGEAGNPSSSPQPRALGSAPPPHAAQPPPPPPPELAATLPRGPADPVPGPAASPRAIEREAAKRPAPRPGVVAHAAAERATGSWAVNGKLAKSVEGEQGPSGPVGGLAKGVPTADVAFAASAKQARMKAAKPEPAGQVEPLPDDFGDDFFEPDRGGVGKWIVAGSLVVILGAAAVVYLLVFREGGGKKAAAVHDAAAELGANEPPAALDGGAPEANAGASADALAIDDARQALLADDTSTLVSILPRLANASGADTDAVILTLRSRIAAALAQQLLDRAEINAESAPDQAKELRREAAERAGEAAKHAEKALAASADDPAANVAMADASRMQGKTAREVERWLQKGGDEREAKLVGALLQIREKKLRRARSLLEALEADDALEKTGDVRPRYRLALLDFAAKEYAKARDSADAVLAVEPGHTGAAVLVERVRAATTVVTSDPMPPEVNDTGGGRPGGSESYDTLLARANQKAEVGKCSAAMSIYQRALDLNPSGVAALTGLGYCHLDAGQFASAQAKFRAALGISPRYQEALLGVAEAYQQQGLKDKAIAAYERFVEEHPTSARAQQARRQIEKLGGKPASGGGASEAGAGGATGDTTDEPSSGGSGGGGEGAGSGEAAGSGEGDSKTGGSGTESGGDSPAGDTEEETDKEEAPSGPGAAALDDLAPSPKPPAKADDEAGDP